MHIALFLFLIFSDVFEGFVPMANYWDELATVLVVCWGAVVVGKASASFWQPTKASRRASASSIAIVFFILTSLATDLACESLLDIHHQNSAQIGAGAILHR